ncbi:aldehyde dehydrogenase family protein [Aestuariicella hydrocarbonica]|uniref:Aldehyde dehydrogenase family protein n=1 Tax=Pseudomaricurvus hydrocarbonicus TaxID=1470433 RepID=A0A9E5JSL4_9GAMM|nr:aldehyde dehydrogenase family protein [Aestuariicella hydrocarbonica]NHO66018.1 aldehyde dehydrogenase family protein [Aestuariicella hydrocarbonica]
MRESLQFYIDGQWVDPIELKTVNTINPATEEVSGKIALGEAADVDRAVQAARKAFPAWSQSSREERLALLKRILEEYNKRAEDLAAAITEEMGAPKGLAQGFQVGLGLGHLTTAIEVLKNFQFEELHGASLIVKEPIGVCGLVTPWNWPVNQVTVKVFPAIATGCTVVLKASQESHYSAQVLAEIFDAAGVPAGVFNMVQGKGSVVGAAMAAHPEVDMISITGSEMAGVDVAVKAAPGVKRVCQELGGKGPNIILDDDNFAANVSGGVISMMINSGQTCSSPSRMLVPNSRMDDAIDAAREAITQVTVGDPNGDFAMGPVVSEKQFSSIQTLIHKGIDEGAELIAGGPGRPEGIAKGFFVKPTVFAKVSNDMVIAQEEIFGPVLVIIGYDDVDHAVDIANDTEFGLAGFVAGNDLEQCRAIARRVRAGSLSINGGFDFNAPFGGYKKSGNGREWGEHGFHEYLEVKAILGYAPDAAQ